MKTKTIFLGFMAHVLIGGAIAGTFNSDIISGLTSIINTNILSSGG